MANLRNILRISHLQWHKALRRPHFWLLAVLIPLLAYRYMRPAAQFSRAVEIGATPAGLAFFLSDYGLSLIFCLGLILLLAQAPFLDEQLTYVLLRCDNKLWYAGTLLYCLEASLLYLAYWCACLLLPLMGNMEWSLSWGKIWSSLCQTSAAYDYNLAIKTPYILMAYDGAQALALSLALKGLFCWIIAALIFVGNMPWRFPWGTACAILLMLQDYFAMNGHGFAYYWFSPATMSRLSMLDNTNTFLQPSPSEALLTLSAAALVVLAVGWIVSSRIELSKGAKS
jgi:hypothetical protein